ncbi:hypothetical protein PI124_g15223 [Phytophthora idaei]|nr:hypothetical protein PI124_g15223 [Phytophthora idaei]
MSGFRARWRELLREGWKSKVPTGLSNDYTYLMPGKTKKDVRGVDFYVGEAELLAYLDRIALEEMKKAATARHKAKAAANRPTIQSGQPQIGMSNSQGDGGPLNPNADTADTACANEQSSNAAASSSQGDENLTPGVDPAVATNLTAEVGDEDVDDAHHTRSLNAEFDVAAASGSEYACSEADVSDANSPSRCEEDQSADTQREEAQSTAKYAGISRMMLDDPNFIVPGDNPADFAALYSEGEKKKLLFTMTTRTWASERLIQPWRMLLPIQIYILNHHY